MNRMTKLHEHILFEDDDVWVYNKPENVSILRDRGGHEDLWSVLNLIEDHQTVRVLTQVGRVLVGESPARAGLPPA